MSKELKILYAFFLLYLIIVSCNTNNPLKRELKKSVHNLKNYDFNNKTNILSRINKNKNFVLDYLKKLDNRKDYTIYVPTKNELKIISKTFKLLPLLHKKVLQNNLISIYFINNFLSNGYTEWVMDKNNHIFAFIVFNTRVLKNNISKLITDKENTCFIDDDSLYDIQINCGNKYNGFLYILTHEATHIVDYVKNITPYVEPVLKNYYNKPGPSLFVKDIWKDYFTPVDKYNFKERKYISFYGLSGPVKLKISDAVKIYKKLMKTPFTSLYGSLNWAEDLAEFVVYYHLTQKLDIPYSIKVYRKNKLIFKFEPMKLPLVRERFRTVQQFYNE